MAHHSTNRLSRILIVAGILVLAAVLLVYKAGSDNRERSTMIAGNPPALQLDQALQAGQPTLAFFHSNNCKQCIVMIETVGRVYPEFRDSVTLVDVNVYEEQNQALLRRVGLQYIPTLIFYDRAGQGKVAVGVMEPEQLRKTLAALSGGE